MADPTISEQAEKWEQVGEQVFTGVVSAWVKSDIAKFITTLFADVIGGLVAVGVAGIAPVGVGIAKGIALSEDLVAPALAPMAAAAVSDLFGVTVPASAFEGGIQGGHIKSASDALAAGLLKIFEGGGAALEPSHAGAERYIGVMVNMALEGWYQGWFLAFISHLIPQLDIGKIENFGSLDDKMAKVLGLDRLSRRVLGPIVDAAIVTPLTWSVNKQYRPELLTESMAVRQFTSGQWSEAQMTEELARQGWSDDRIAAFRANHTRYLSFDDAYTLVREGSWSTAYLVEYLRRQGWDREGADALVSAEYVKRLATFRDDSLAALKRAYVDRQIGDGEFRSFLHAIVYDDAERGALETAMQTVRELNVKRLTQAEVKEAVRRGILAMVDYRRWLASEGYDDRDSFVLELTFRAQLDEESKIAQHAQDAVVERAQEKARKDLEARARKAAVDAERALNRRGSLATLERAVVRGLIPVTRYADVLSPQYDADTVQIMVGLIQQARADYLDQQQRTEDARKRAAIRNVDVGVLNQAVLTGVLTLDEFRGRLEQLGFSGADAGLLTDTLRARLDDAATAADLRAKAAAAAKIKSIDLGRFERLVVRGVRTMDQYAALLTSLGFDEGSRAAMGELVQLQIADAAAAVEQRRLAALQASTHDVTLEQMRRAVVLDLLPEAAFQTYLVTHGFTTAAQAVLLAELRADVIDTEAARARRVAAEAASQVRALPLSTLARAVRLGLVPIDVYDRRLTKDGYSDDDRAIELLLLTFERDDLAASRSKRDAPPPAPDPKGLSLAELARAVKAGVSTLNDYAGRAYQLGYSQEAVETLVAVLGQELQVQEAAQAIHDAPPPAPTRALSVAQYEAAVKTGAMTLSDFTANVQALGYEEDAAALLTFLLTTKLQAGTGE